MIDFSGVMYVLNYPLYIALMTCVLASCNLNMHAHTYTQTHIYIYMVLLFSTLWHISIFHKVDRLILYTMTRRDFFSIENSNKLLLISHN